MRLSRFSASVPAIQSRLREHCSVFFPAVLNPAVFFASSCVSCRRQGMSGSGLHASSFSSGVGVLDHFLV